MKVKEILNLTDEQLEKMMTEEQFERMHNLGFEYVWQFLDVLQESARTVCQNEDEEHVSIEAYLDYLEDIKEE